MEIPAAVLTACSLLRTTGHKAYLVGGCVRDTIMGLDPKDWDICTDALPDVLLQLPCKVIPTGIQFGTVTAIVEGMSIEITTFRLDSPVTDGRRPESVAFGCSLEEDLARRDFTCNAIAYDPVEGEFIDPFGGREHIYNQVLMCVGRPTTRFQEDALRMMRAVRFACTKNFHIDRTVQTGIGANCFSIENVSKERIRDELLKILGSIDPGFGIDLLHEHGLLAFICPELLKGVGMHQNDRWHKYQVYDHVIACLDGCAEAEDSVSRDPIVRLAVLLHDIAKPVTREPHPKEPGQFRFLDHENIGADMAADWMREYKFSNEEVDRVRHIIRHHLIHYESRWSNPQVRRWVRTIGKENIPDIMAMARADLLGKGFPSEERMATLNELERRAYEVQAQVVQPGKGLAISGHEVMALLGITSGGPAVGKCLKFLADAVLEDPELNTNEDLLGMAKEWIEKGVN